MIDRIIVWSCCTNRNMIIDRYIRIRRFRRPSRWWCNWRVHSNCKITFVVFRAKVHNKGTLSICNRSCICDLRPGKRICLCCNVSFSTAKTTVCLCTMVAFDGTLKCLEVFWLHLICIVHQLKITKFSVRRLGRSLIADWIQILYNLCGRFVDFVCTVRCKFNICLLINLFVAT